MKLNQLLRGVALTGCRADQDVEITGVSYDTRTMAPGGLFAALEGYKTDGQLYIREALEKGAQPLREFMLRQTREADLGLFARLANTGPLQGPEAVPMRILLPAYVTSELKTAFQIGFTIFIPFLIIDLVIASVLMALGMMMVPPATIALPFKLMLFVLVDGWQLLVGSLAQSFYS